MPTWNTNWDTYPASGSPWALLSAGIIAPFIAAVAERVAVLDQTIAGTQPAIAIPASGDPAIRASSSFFFGGGTVLGWGDLCGYVGQQLASFFLRTTADDRTTPIDYNSTLSLDSWLYKYDSVHNQDVQTPFPPPNGFRRRYPREIYTVGYTGPAAVGNRARFVNFQGSPWHNVPVSHALFSLPATTPLGEQQYAGKMFVYSGGLWQLSSDQTSGPDIVIDPEGTGFLAPLTGDIFGPWILEDLRQAINLLTVTVSALTDPSNLNATVLRCEVAASAGGNWGYGGHTWHREGTDITYAGAVTNYNSYVNTAGRVLPAALSSGGPGTPGAWSIARNFGYLGNADTVPPFLPNPNNQLRHVTGWCVIDKQSTNVFDTLGDGIPVGDFWQQFGDIGNTASTTFQGPQLGPFPDGNPPPERDDHLGHGWGTKTGLLIFDWGITGGFAYSKLT